MEKSGMIKKKASECLEAERCFRPHLPFNEELIPP